MIDSRPSAVDLIVTKRPDIMAVDNEGSNIFHMLLTGNEKHQYIRSSHTRDLGRFLELPLGLMLPLQKGNASSTPLHYALRNKQLWDVGSFLYTGADPLEPETNGNTPLHLLSSLFTNTSNSAQHRDPSPLTSPLFRKFLFLEADINSRNVLGETPILHLVASNGSCLEHLKMFIKAGADIHIKNNMKKGLLHVLAKKKGSPITEKDEEKRDVGDGQVAIGEGVGYFD